MLCFKCSKKEIIWQRKGQTQSNLGTQNRAPRNFRGRQIAGIKINLGNVPRFFVEINKVPGTFKSKVKNSLK